MFRELRASIGLLLVLTLLTGVGYPLLMTALGQALFPHQANGSLIKEGNRIIGSELIGQNFNDPKYFFARPSVAGSGYDAANSSGSNMDPSSQKLFRRIGVRVKELRKSDDARPIPVDLVTASGSGLDPDISVAAALYQAPRVAERRGLPLHQVENLIKAHTTPRTFGVLGEQRVNVLAINRDLDLLSFAPQATTVK